jgi:hypothetical protein
MYVHISWTCKKLYYVPDQSQLRDYVAQMYPKQMELPGLVSYQVPERGLGNHKP